MRNITLIFTFLLPLTLSAQEFNFVLEPQAFPVTMESGWQPYSPWAGGMSESSPELVDIDADGDLDFFIGRMIGQISYFENTGQSSSPEFIFITSEFAGVDIGGYVYAGRTCPEFCDLDGDGDLDLLSSDFRGQVHYWENIGSTVSPEFQWITDSLDYIDVTGRAKISLIDIDADFDYDILLGDYPGKIVYYRNEGDSVNWDFVLETEQFEGIDVGYNADPCFVDIDDDHDYDLFIGNDIGKMWYYRNDGDSANYNYTLVSSFFDSIDVGDYCSPEFADIDDDGDLDMFLGSAYDYPVYMLGNIHFYENTGTPANPQLDLVTTNYITADFGYVNIPQFVDIDNDQAYEMIIENSIDSLLFFESTGTPANPGFSLSQSTIAHIGFSGAYPWFVDIDADSDYDLILGQSILFSPPSISLYRNEGTPEEPNLVLENSQFVTNPDFWVNACPCMADIDADGDQDLFITDDTPWIFYYRNDGSPQNPRFTYVTDEWQGVLVTTWRGLAFSDLDGDLDMDLLVNNNNSSNLAYYRNEGTPIEPDMVLITNDFLDVDIPGAYPYIVVIDDDGDFDLFCSDVLGGLWFFRNETDSTPEIQISIEGSDIILTWGSIASAVEYQIFYQNIPYFTPEGIPQAVVLPPDTTWVDEGGLNEWKRYYRMIVTY